MIYLYKIINKGCTSTEIGIKMIKALIIDDNMVNIELLKAYLELYKIEVIGAETGKKGVELAQTLLPDAIFMDLLMPSYSWNGYQATLELKNNPLTKHIPVVAVSSAGDMDLARDSGCSYFLTRPFEKIILAKLLQQMGIIAEV